MIYVELFITFFVIGMFTVGGGYAMLSLIQHQVVVVHQWISAQAFTDIVAISQMTPGPIGINGATYIGYSVVETMGYSPAACVAGSLTASIAVVIPSFLITLFVCKLYEKFKENNTFSTVLHAFKPVAIGLIAAAAILMINPETFIDYKSWILFAAAFVASMWKLVNPIFVIIVGGFVGVFLYL